LSGRGLNCRLSRSGKGLFQCPLRSDALESDLLAEKIRHGGHPVLAMCAANAVAVKDPAGNRKLDKSKATGRIDGMVALAMAEGVEAMFAEAEAYSPWDDPSFSLVA
jgi:phage terminase large subunit-like protein